MKKVMIGAFLALGLLAFTGCSSNANSLKVYAQDTQGKAFECGTAEVVFKNDSKVPYVAVDDGVKIMDDIRKASLGKNSYYKIESSDSGVTVSNEKSAKCTISKEAQQVVYNDFDGFVGVTNDGVNPLSVVDVDSNVKAIKITSSEYTKGSEVKADLTKYSKIDLYYTNSKYYLPVAAFNTLFFGNMNRGTFAYNFKDLYIVPSGGLTVDVLGIALDSELGEKFYDGMNDVKLSDDYYEYYYQSLCLDFDVNYGLRDKFSTFDSFLSEKGFKNDLLTKDVRTQDGATTCALSYLNDGHTAVTSNSRMYDEEEKAIDLSKYNQTKATLSKAQEAYAKSRQAANIKTGIIVSGETAIVSFDEFTAIDNDMLYSQTAEKNIANTAYLFNTLYREVTNGFTIRNVVVDLSNNEGGAAESMVYALSVLFGEIEMDMINPVSGAHNHQKYMADINADGVINNNDICLTNYGLNVVFITSKYSFSCGNAMAVYAKTNNKNVVTVGETTGGGPCLVRTVMTPIGSFCSTSSLFTLAKTENNKCVNIGGGVAADYALTEAQMIDRTYIKQKLSDWIK